MARFSERHGFGTTDTEIRIRNDAPDELRSVVLQIAYEVGLSPTRMRSLMCRLLRKRANQGNWSEWPNVASECEDLIHGCSWYEVYDAIEKIYEVLLESRFNDLTHGPGHEADKFAKEINHYFRREGIGWQLVGGNVEMRGPEVFETAVHEAGQLLASYGKQTSTSELHEAVRDLSRRPEPDVTGAVQHAMSALECVTREVCGNCKPTLGDLMKRYPNTFPKPLDQAVEKLWGYSSETGRHLKEGSSPSFEEAELIVGLSGVLCRYLASKLRPLVIPGTPF